MLLFITFFVLFYLGHDCILLGLKLEQNGVYKHQS